MSALGPLVRAARAAAPGRARLALSALLGAVAVGATMGLLATSGYLISKAALAPPILTLTVAIVAVRAFAVARATARYAERLASHDVSLRALAEIRACVFERLAPLVPGSLPRGRSGDLLSRAVADVDSLQHLFVRVLGPPAVAILAVAGAAIVAGLMSPAAGLALGLALGLAAVGLPLLAWAAGRRSGRRQAPARGALTERVLDALRLAPEIAAYGLEDEAVDRVRSADRALERTARRDAKLSGLSTGLVALLAGGCAAAVLAVAVPEVRAGRLDGVLLAALALLAIAAAEAVAPLPAAAQHLAATSAAARRIEEVTLREPAVRDPEDPRPLPIGPPALAVEGARLRYSTGGPWVLDGVDLTLEPGRRVALLGPSGSGKSSLLHALVRFRDLDGGRARLGGVDLRELAQEDVRRVVRLAGQDAHLFATTIRENVLIGRPEASDGAVLDGLARAGLAAWIAELPEGLDTFVGEDGARVSGGQRQRIALARVLVSDAPVMLLDEPTAHLDAAAAEAFVADLAGAAGGASVLLVTHSTAGLERFDEVAILEEGRIVERGTHAELLAREGGRYAEMAAREAAS